MWLGHYRRKEARVGAVCISRLTNQLRASWAQQRPAGKQAAQADKEQAGLAAADVPKDAGSLVPCGTAERLAHGVVHPIHKAAVVGLLKAMDRAADEQVQV